MTPANFVFMCCIATTLGLAGAARADAPATAAAAAAVSPGADCAAETARREQADGIPRGLLSAIARTESGRWDAASGTTRPWPWTVTSGSDGRFFTTKAEAVAEVEILLTQGVTNVDVGCMQINMNHHWDAFETLEEAFDPAANVAYAAEYLRAMRDDTRSWEAAAGRYHSMTPSRARYYRGKVMAHWRDIRAAAGRDEEPDAVEETAEAAPAADEPAVAAVATVDAARMAELNATFRVRRGADRADAGETSSETLRRLHLERWREARSRQAGLQHLLAARQAELERKRRKLLEKAERLNRDVSFPARRRQQLEAWRNQVSGAGDS